jgi:ribosomal protein S18 acetylase RimI-like enzyme
MSTDSKNLVQLDKSHIRPAAEMLSRAFRDYPLLQYCFPDELEREKVAPYFFQFILYYGIRYGDTYATSPNLEGVALWIPSDNYPVTFWKLIRSVPLSVIFGLGRYGGGRMRHIGEHIDAVHQRLAPFKHWFLQTIGVDPQFQGKGYAGKVLRPMFFRIDGEDLPCYLETLDEQNVQLYEHFGFKVVEKATIPKTSLTNWAMLRDAQ